MCKTPQKTILLSPALHDYKPFHIGTGRVFIATIIPLIGKDYFYEYLRMQ